MQQRQKTSHLLGGGRGPRAGFARSVAERPSSGSDQREGTDTAPSNRGFDPDLTRHEPRIERVHRCRNLGHLL